MAFNWAQSALTEQQAHAIAVDAYLYFYPLVSMDVTRKQSTNIEPGREFGRGPMNSFTNAPEYPPGNLKLVVRVNFDTLYSIAWLDMTEEPMVISAPNTNGRNASARANSISSTAIFLARRQPFGRSSAKRERGSVARRFDVGSARNVVLGIGKVSRAPFGSSPERPAVGSMAGFPQVRERLKVERELLRLSDKDGQKWRADERDVI
jgi:hypothetical protein